MLHPIKFGCFNCARFLKRLNQRLFVLCINRFRQVLVDFLARNRFFRGKRVEVFLRLSELQVRLVLRGLGLAPLSFTFCAALDILDDAAYNKRFLLCPSTLRERILGVHVVWSNYCTMQIFIILGCFTILIDRNSWLLINITLLIRLIVQFVDFL